MFQKIPEYGSSLSLLIYLHRDMNAYIVIKAVNRADAVMILNADKRGIAQKLPNSLHTNVLGCTNLNPLTP